ncbi:hydantoinase/oxoprolinase [Salinisphaera sp. PC39]|uniref:hydantoinase/oxoprolinase family protein n=1 Tax=Salinisphaera sp. PC39 TaxID=1304156 RepID=UPI0033409DB9
MGLLINVDNGGTFTDVCVSDGERIVNAKAATTPHDLTVCFVDALTRAAEAYYGEDDIGRLVRETDHLRYSTTAGTNAVVEGKGMPIGVILADGEQTNLYGHGDAFRDSRLWQVMVPTEPVGLTLDGSEAEQAAVTEAVNGLLTQGVSRIVICMPTAEDERRVKSIIFDRFPRHLLGAVPVLFSYELSTDRNHARRLSTAVLNAFLHPVMEGFLYGAEEVARRHHMENPLLIFRNDGASARVAKTTAIKTYSSGPAGGLVGAAQYADHYGAPAVVSFDIGGTTTDFAAVVEGKASSLSYGKAGGLPFSFEMGEVDSIGAGGSSVLRVADGQVTVGPESVGAAPGPACFARGGTEATITDVLLLAGVVDRENFLGGTLSLDTDRARQAVEKNIAEPLGVSLDEALVACVDAYESKVADKARAMLEERGLKPADALLLAFGGAGPMNASGVAAKAGVRRLIVPHLSPVFSAYGIGFSDLGQQYFLEAEDVEDMGMEAARASLLLRARRDMFGEGVDPDAATYEFSVWFDREGYADATPLNGAGPKKGQRLLLTATYPLPKFDFSGEDPGRERDAEPSGSTELALGGTREIPVYDAGSMQPGDGADGPALIRGGYLTCLVNEGWGFHVSPNRDLILEAKQ